MVIYIVNIFIIKQRLVLLRIVKYRQLKGTEIAYAVPITRDNHLGTFDELSSYVISITIFSFV